MMRKSLFFSLLSTAVGLVWGWTTTAPWRPTSLVSQRRGAAVRSSSRLARFMAADDGDDPAEKVERTSFDQAGASLIEEEDQKRMEQMGDFDSNESYQKDSMEALRAKIRERTESMGIEKSKVTAEYIAQREKTAREGGPPGTQQDANMFGGLDLSQISETKESTKSGQDWDESMPTMFYDPEADLSKEEQEEVDPLMLKNPIEQGWAEFSQANWPGPGTALREVAIMFVVIAITTCIVIAWDTVLRSLYTGVGFIPSKEDIANYASRFDGLDLPEGWTTGMTDVDVQSYSDTISGSGGNVMPDVGSAVSGGIPEL